MKATAALIPTSSSTTPKRDTRVTGQTLRAFANRDAPINQEQPDAIREMPDRRGDSNHVNDERSEPCETHGRRCRTPGQVHVPPKSCSARDHSEAEIEHVESDKEEQNDAGDSLDQVKPVARIRIREIVWPRFHRDHQTIDGVIDERYKDAADLDEKDVGNRLEIFDGVIEIRRSGERF